MQSRGLGKASYALACVLVCGTPDADAGARRLPTDAQVQAAFGATYNHLGLMEHCAAKGFATAAEVANTRKTVAATTRRTTVGAASPA